MLDIGQRYSVVRDPCTVFEIGTFSSGCYSYCNYYSYLLIASQITVTFHLLNSFSRLKRLKHHITDLLCANDWWIPLQIANDAEGVKMMMLHSFNNHTYRYTYNQTTIGSRAWRRPQPCTPIWPSVLDTISPHRFDITVVKMYNVTIDQAAQFYTLSWCHRMCNTRGWHIIIIKCATVLCFNMLYALESLLIGNVLLCRMCILFDNS